MGFTFWNEWQNKISLFPDIPFFLDVPVLEWIQKDHMTLKTEVTADENFDFHHWIKLYFKAGLTS